MVTVLRLNGLRVVIYTNDHRPPHVHVIDKGREREAVFKLNCPGGPPELREVYGFRRGELTRIEQALAENLGTLCDEWERIHGQP